MPGASPPPWPPPAHGQQHRPPHSHPPRVPTLSNAQSEPSTPSQVTVCVCVCVFFPPEGVGANRWEKLFWQQICQFFLCFKTCFFVGTKHQKTTKAKRCWYIIRSFFGICKDFCESILATKKTNMASHLKSNHLSYQESMVSVMTHSLQNRTDFDRKIYKLFSLQS